MCDSIWAVSRGPTTEFEPTSYMFEPLGKEPEGAGQDRSSLLIQLDDEIFGERSVMESPRWERTGGFGSIDVWYAGKAGLGVLHCWRLGWMEWHDTQIEDRLYG